MRSQLLADTAVIIHRVIQGLVAKFEGMDLHFNRFGLKFFGIKQWEETKNKFPPIKRRFHKVFIPCPYAQPGERLN